jgi:hypothetical protein
MYSATYRRELNKTVARESAHLWDKQEEGGTIPKKRKETSPATRRKPSRKPKTADEASGNSPAPSGG